MLGLTRKVNKDRIYVKMGYCNSVMEKNMIQLFKYSSIQVFKYSCIPRYLNSGKGQKNLKKLVLPQQISMKHNFFT